MFRAYLRTVLGVSIKKIKKHLKRASLVNAKIGRASLENSYRIPIDCSHIQDKIEVYAYIL